MLFRLFKALLSVGGGVLLFFPVLSKGQAQTPGDTFQVKVREVPYDSSTGEPVIGSIPDSLGNAYLYHNNGKVYKHFNSYESALAHFRSDSYHPRNEVPTEDGRIFITTPKAYPPQKFIVIPSEDGLDQVRVAD